MHEQIRQDHVLWVACLVRTVAYLQIEKLHYAKQQMGEITIYITFANPLKNKNIGYGITDSRI